MAIVRYLVELHGGTVSAESPGENLGATFTIALPASLELDLETDRIEPGVRAAADQSIDDLTGLEGVSVLVANDEPESR
jgi:two-component system CheB/CheR fusion protein